jgi:hypothetical protein
MAIPDAHPYEDVKERLKVMPIIVALALEYLNCYELHGSSPVASSTRHAVELLCQVHVNQSPFRVSFGSSGCNDDIIFRNIPMAHLPIL